MKAELWLRIAFTLGVLLVYRLGTFIPLPGINLSFWSGFAPTRLPGVLELVDAVGSTGTARLTLFALGIGPYFVAAVLLQLPMLLSRRLRAPLQRGEARSISRYSWPRCRDSEWRVRLRTSKAQS